MNYIICQDWVNTRNSHAGMAYLGGLIESIDPNEFRLIIVPDWTIYFKNIFLVKLQFKLHFYLYAIVYFFLALYLSFKLKKGDKIFLFEFLGLGRNQYIVANIVKKLKGEGVKIYGLVHLTPTIIKNAFSKEIIHKNLAVLDSYLTLGSSLTNYFIENGVPKDKVVTSFHYVDNNYWKPKVVGKIAGNPTVIFLGMQMRNIELTAEIVKSNPNVNFVICKGLFDIDHHFAGCNNVTLKGFMSEDDLKEQMDKADILINPMIDTVGSNVITTSMSMGLAIVVSDVGSIRDYCDESNAIFCDNSNVLTFKEALETLINDREKLYEMQQNSISKAALLNVDRFCEQIFK